MKNLLLMFVFVAGLFSTVQAQNESASTDKMTIDDYERYIDAQLEIQFRSTAIEALGLTKEEIVKFDPLYREYMREKSSLVDKKYRLLNEYTEEMKEDDSVKDETDETGDFVEDYWEVEIDEMKLKKAYFDRMDEIMSPRQAMDFFMLEEALQNRITDKYISHYIPVIVQVERPVYEIKVEEVKDKDMDKPKDDMTSKGKPNTKYKSDIDAYATWYTTHKGAVSLEHNYTHDGLHKLVSAINAVAAANSTDLSAHATKMARIQTLANELQKNKYSDKHADKAKEAFVIASELLKAVQTKNNFASEKVDKVADAAQKINVDVLMTKQAEHIYNFFDAALAAVNQMSAQTTWVAK